MPKKKGNLESGRIMDDWQITLCIDVIGDVWYYLVFDTLRIK